MLFNSYVFWAFLAAVLAAYRVLPHRGQNALLLVASYVFYGAWDWRFLSLIWLSTAVDYVAAQRVHDAQRPATRRAWLTASMVTNLGLLGVFKYYGFFAEEAAGLLALFGLEPNLPTLHVVLPVGISFYTFQTMSYTIDVYRREAAPSRDLLDFALYVCFFPQLVAGPIERFGRLMPQVTTPRVVDGACFREGLYHVLIGLVKKVAIADNLAPVTNAIFATPADQLSGPECVVGVYAFAMQVYGDFSGYSSIAQGVAKWLGFDLMFNFRMPYFAVSPSDFWRRWHVSLSQWLRDYLYIPLGGNRGGAAATYRNLMLTMTLGGLWHGAATTFVAWGAYQGLVLCLYRPFERKLQGVVAASAAARVLAAVAMFHVGCVGWLLFRASSIEQAVGMATRALTDGAGWSSFFAGAPSQGVAWAGLGLVAFYAGPMLLYELWVERRGDLLAILRAPWLARAALYAYFALLLWFFPPPLESVFIYFQF